MSVIEELRKLHDEAFDENHGMFDALFPALLDCAEALERGMKWISSEAVRQEARAALDKLKAT